MSIAELIGYTGNRDSGPGSLLIIAKETYINSTSLCLREAREHAASILVGAVRSFLNSPGNPDLHFSGWSCA